MLQKIKHLVVVVILLVPLFIVLGLSGDFVYAQRTVTSTDGKCPGNDKYVKLSVPLKNGSDCVLKSDRDTSLEDNSIIVYTRNIVRFLSAGVGIVIVLMIIIGGIQYITSQGNPQATASAKNRITNAIISLFLFIFMTAILNFLIPGGLL